MAPHRITIKIYFADGAVIDPPRIVPLFHEWIRSGALEGMLIDVADYKHVHHGPATVLIGNEADYTIDLSDGRPGLMITRKRPAPDDLRDDLRRALRRLLVAARAMQAKTDPHPPVSFRTDEWRVQALDRLRFANTAENFTTLSGEARAALGDVFQGADLRIENAGPDPRGPLTLRLSAPGAPDLDALLSRLPATSSY